MQMESKLQNVLNILDEAASILGDHSKSFAHGGATISMEEVNNLRRVHGILQEKFEDSLAVIRARTDER